MRRAAAASVVNYLHTHTHTRKHTERGRERAGERHSAVYVAHTRCCLKYGGKFTLLLSCSNRRYSSPLPLTLCRSPLLLLISLPLSQRPLHACFSVGFLLFFLEIAVKNNKASHEFLASASPSPSPSPSSFRFLSSCLVSLRFL